MRKAWILVVALLAATPAMANIGSPLLFVGLMYMLWGNLIIACVEATVLCWRYDLKVLATTGAVVAANYLTAYVGVVLAPMMLAPIALRTLAPPPQTAVWPALLILYAITFVLSVLLEAPFIWLVLTREQRARRGALRASLLAQTTTYAVLVFFSVTGSRDEMLRGAEWVQPGELTNTADVRVYYLDADDGELYVCRLDGTGRRKLRALASPDPVDRLKIRRTGAETPRYELWRARHQSDGKLVGIERLFDLAPADDDHLARPYEAEAFWTSVEADGDTHQRVQIAGSLWGLPVDGREWLSENLAVAVHPVGAVGLPGRLAAFQVGASSGFGRYETTAEPPRVWPEVYAVEVDTGRCAVVARARSFVVLWTRPADESPTAPAPAPRRAGEGSGGREN